MQILYEPVAVRHAVLFFLFDAAIEDKPLGNREGEKQVPSRNILHARFSTIRRERRPRENKI